MAQARREEEKKSHSEQLNDRVRELKGTKTESVSAAEDKQASDNEAFKRAKKQVRARELGDKKQIESEMLGTQSDKQHVNLFRAE